MSEPKPNLELLHQLADRFAAGSDDAGVGPGVQVDVLAHHLLQLGHQLLNGLTRLLHVPLVPRDHDQVLPVEPRASALRSQAVLLQDVHKTTHLILVALVGELDVHVVIFPDLRDDGSFASDDFGVELWIHRHGHFKAAQSLKMKSARENSV